jgi:hypothetical protein
MCQRKKFRWRIAQSPEWLRPPRNGCGPDSRAVVARAPLGRPARVVGATPRSGKSPFIHADLTTGPRTR